MRRRHVLALSGSLLAGTAGCLSSSAPGSSGPTTESQTTTASGSTNEETTTHTSTGSTDTTTGSTDTTTGSTDTTTTSSHTTTVKYPDLSVELVALQPAMVTMTSPDSIGVSRRDARYLLVDVSADGDGQLPAPGEFSFEVGDAAYRPEPVDDPWRFWRFYDDEDAVYDRETGGILVVGFPEDAGSNSETAGSDAEDAGSDADTASDDADTASDDADTPGDDGEGSGTGPVLAWPGGEWRPPASVRRRLARPEPPLSVTLDVPETVPYPESPTVSVTVENAGDVPGRFVAGLNRTGPLIAYAPVKRLSVPVPAGGTETWEHTDDSIMAGDYDERVGDGETDMTYHLDWAGGDVRKGVRYVEG